MRSILILLFLSTTSFQFHCFAQDDPGLEEIMENIAIDSDESEDLDMIEILRQNPIDLYNASASDITQIPSISMIQAKRIVDFLDEYKNTTFAILADSTGLSPHQEILLENCSYLDYQEVKSKPHFFWRARNQSYLNEVRGIKENQFAGNALDIYNRFMYSGQNIDAGILTNKDMGEESLAEFYSGYVQYRNNNFNIIAGDYSLEYGLGSILWRSFGARKGAEVISTVSQLGRGIRPYRSSMETNFFRGAAASVDFGKINISAWYSNIDRAAGIDEENNVANSIYVTGLFRTENELEKRNKLNEQMVGSDISFNIDNFQIGFTGNYLQYAIPIESVSSRYFNGQEGLLTSFYGIYSNETLMAAVETARDSENNLSYKANFETRIEDVSFVAAYRYFPFEFRSPYGFKFGEASYAANEEGFYAGLKYRGLKNVTSSFYADFYRSLHRTYVIPLSTKGIDLFNETTIKLNSVESILIRLKYEDKTDNYKDGEIRQEYIYDKTRMSSRIEYRSQINKKINLRFRIQSVRTLLENNRNESGYAGFGEINWKISDFIKAGSRIAYYSTDSFDSALWLFEYAMPGLMQTNVVYGEGIRSFVYFKISPLEKLDFWFRYTYTSKNNQNSLGSGWNRIDGNKDGRLYFQIDAAF